MMPWSKLPRFLRGDWRLTQRTPLALAAFLFAWLAADDVGVIAPVGARGAREALAAQVATLPGVTLDEAREAVAECLGADLLIEVGATLHLADWVHDGAPPAARTRTPDAPPRRPGRPAKGAAPMSDRERKVRHAFAKRLWVAFRDVAEGVTWEAWSAEHPEASAELLRDRHETRERNPGDGGNETPSDGTKLGNETRERNSGTPRAASVTSPSSEASEEENRGKEEREVGPRDGNETRERNSGTKLGNETRPPGTKPPGVRCPSAESALTLDVDVLLDRMRAASEGRLAAHVFSSGQATGFASLARDLIGRGQTTTEGLIRAAGHALHVRWITRRAEPLTLERLCADEGKVLVELVAGSKTCARCGETPLASDEAPEGEDPVITAARHRYRTEPIGPGETP